MNETIKLEGYTIKLIHPDDSHVLITDENGCSKHVGVYPVVMMFKRIKELEKLLNGILPVFVGEPAVRIENEKLKAHVKELIECNHRWFHKNQEYASKIEKMAGIGPSDVENEKLKTLVKSVSKDRNDTLEQQLNRIKELEAENERLNTVIPYQQPALIKLLITMTEDYNSGRIRLAPSAYNTLIKAVVAELQGETI